MLMTLAGSLLSGCLSRPALSRQLFTFSIPTNDSSAVVTNGRVLAIRLINVATPFAGQSFVYSTGELSYEQDPYAQFLVPPEESLAQPVRSYLRQSEKFQTVVEPESALKPNLVVEISTPQLYGDFRNRSAPAAVLTMTFAFFEAPDGLPGKMISEKSYAGRIPLKSRTAAALMAGWDDGLRRILSEPLIFDNEQRNSLISADER